MKKHLFVVLLLFLSQLSIYGQSFDKELFINYEEVVKKLKSAKNTESFEEQYDYTSLLLLDSTEIKLIEKTGFQYIDDFRNFASGLSLSKQTFGFVTDKKSIKDIFMDKNSLVRILECSKSYNSPNLQLTKFNYPIYVKGNTAIFKTSASTWSDTYFARLENGVLQINWLGGIIE